MADIVNITLYKVGDSWEIGVVRNDDYTEHRVKDLSKYSTQVEGIVEVAQQIKSEKQIQIEELEKEKEEMFLILDSKLTDEERLERIEIYPEWVEGVKYSKDTRIRFDGRLYKVLQEHTSQSDWLPDIALSLYLEVVANNTIPTFKQPTGSHDAYKINDRVEFEGYIWVSIIDNNVWSPRDYPQGWEKEREV